MILYNADGEGVADVAQQVFETQLPFTRPDAPPAG